MKTKYNTATPAWKTTDEKIAELEVLIEQINRVNTAIGESASRCDERAAYKLEVIKLKRMDYLLHGAEVSKAEIERIANDPNVRCGCEDYPCCGH
tara:strand:- start:1705 stop:1989 length:285 start_codon:yes stop_codon:yes gene_type:complete